MKKHLKTYEKSGVVLVMEEAEKKGFFYGNKEWVNLGQGAPEVKKILDSPERITHVDIPDVNQGYASVAGLKQLRQNVANIYNDLFRKDKKPFDFSNISIAGGGRLALSRAFSILEPQTRIAHFIPDYASYEGIISLFNNTISVPFFLKKENKLKIDLNELKQRKDEYDAIFFSNPTNPTGTVLNKQELSQLVEFVTNEDKILIIDEFYFNYIYLDDIDLLSSAEFIQDIDNTKIMIISGITKAWRYPGWRIGWIISSKDIVEKVSSVGSFLDGGANNPMQYASLSITNTQNLLQETVNIKKAFKQKRDLLVQELKNLGFIIDNNPDAGFYVWTRLDNFKPPFNNAWKLLDKFFEQKLIAVPGIYFDINPYKLRPSRRFENYMRFSYSPNIDIINEGIKRLRLAIKDIV